MYRFIQRNKVSAGEDAEMISPGKIGRGFAVRELYAQDGTVLVYSFEIDSEHQPGVLVPFDALPKADDPGIVLE